MKKVFKIFLSYLLITFNSFVFADENKQTNVLKIGVLAPMSGDLKSLGEEMLYSINLALHDINDPSIKIYPKDSKGNALDSYKSAKEFEKLGIKIVIGPLLHESNERLGEINSVSFISLTNKTENLPKNIIAFGVNVNSQIEVIKKYFKEKNISKTILLSPKNNFEKQTNLISDSKLNFYKTSICSQFSVQLV